MVETICPGCGNRKAFQDSHVGKTFKCPNCNNPVTIQNVGSQLNTEPISQTNSFATEIALAEADKKRQEEEDIKKAISNQTKSKKNAVISLVIVVPFFSLLCYIMSLPSGRTSNLNPFLLLMLTLISGLLIVRSLKRIFIK